MPRFAEPVLLSEAALGAAQIDQWRSEGFTLVDGLLPRDLLENAYDDAAEHYPDPGTPEAANFTSFGSYQRFVFPSQSNACNAITLHERLLNAVADLLDCSVLDIRLTQSDLWPKYGREPHATTQDNADQRIHCDYPNHTLTHPPPWDTPEAVEIIIFLNDYAEAEGGTAVVPRQGSDDSAYQWPITRTPGVAGLPYLNDRAAAESYLAEHAPETARFREYHLYAREVLTHYNFGTVLFYRHDTWHRGTPLKLGSRRLVLNMTFKKAASEWVNVLHPGWSWSMYRPSQFMEKLIARATAEQRTVLGFPAPGNAYWTPETIAAVEARYRPHGIDMAPYR